MASIENRSRIVVTVQNRSDLAKTFAFNRKSSLKAYIAKLKADGFKPKLAHTNDSYAIRVREAGHRTQCIYASTVQEAERIKVRIEGERHSNLFTDYAKGRSVTLADLLARYLREEAPRHKGFETEGYIINPILADAGLPRVDIEQAYESHTNTHPSLANMKFRKSSGRTIRTPSAAACFIRKPFADIMPEDFNEYIDDRCQSVQAPTVDREIDIFSAVCRLAIDTWRIPVAKNPMDGIRRPKYFNERNRRLKGNEEERLLNAAFNEDANKSIERRLEELILKDRCLATGATTRTRKKIIIKSARAAYLAEAEASYTHIPWLETFIQFQLMTAARRGESLSAAWKNVDVAAQTVFIPETKNGRPRTLPLRADLISLLQQIPSDTDHVFPISLDSLRKAWARICEAADLVGEDELHVHDLRHESISRVADRGGKLPGGFSLVDLQGFSGHRDTRMLLRYTHLCMPSMAKRLDLAFADDAKISVHRGVRRLRKGASLSMKEVCNASQPAAADTSPAKTRKIETAVPTSNILQFRTRRAA